MRQFLAVPHSSIRRLCSARYHHSVHFAGRARPRVWPLTYAIAPAFLAIERPADLPRWRPVV